MFPLVVVGSGEPIAPSLGDEDTNFPVVMVSSDSPLLDLLKTVPASASLHLDFFGGGLGSTDAEAVFWYGDFLRQSKEVYAATYHYAKALSLEPAFLDAAWALANALFSLNATQEAHRALDFASSERAPDFVEVVHRDLEAAARRMRKLHGEESSTQSGTSLAQRVHVVAHVAVSHAERAVRALAAERAPPLALQTTAVTVMASAKDAASASQRHGCRPSQCAATSRARVRARAMRCAMARAAPGGCRSSRGECRARHSMRSRCHASRARSWSTLLAHARAMVKMPNHSSLTYLSGCAPEG